MNGADVSVRGLRFAYGDNEVLRGVELELPAGTITGLLGPNGCGKSTLISCMYRALDGARGRIAIAGRDAAGMERGQIARLVAVVPQDTRADFELSVRDIVTMGRTAHMGPFGALSMADEDAIARAMRETDVADLADRPFATLSGGERQRAVLARALAQGAPVLLMDEPTAHLDISHQYEVMGLVKKAARDRGTTVLAAMHDMNLPIRYCDRIALMMNGTILFCGPPRKALAPERVRRVFGVRSRLVEDPDMGVWVATGPG